MNTRCDAYDTADTELVVKLKLKDWAEELDDGKAAL